MACKADNTVGELIGVDSEKGESGARTNYSDRTFPVLQLGSTSRAITAAIPLNAVTIESVALSKPTDKESIDIAAGRNNSIRTD